MKLGMYRLAVASLLATAPASAWATYKTCVERVSIVKLATANYNEDPSQWAVSYIDDAGNEQLIHSELSLQTKVGRATFDLLRDAKIHGYLVTFIRTHQSSCIGDAGNWFDAVTVD